MRIKLGANVSTKDGHHAGKITKVVWDPARNEIREFVVNTGGLLGHDVLVSREVLEQGAPKGEGLVVDLTKDELNALDHYDEHAFAPPPYGWLSPTESNYAAEAFLFPVPVPVDEKATNAAEPRRPVIRKGMTVKDAHGQKVGQVDEVRLDDMTGELRAVIVRSGADEATREIPADHLDVGADEIQVIEEAPTKPAR